MSWAQRIVSCACNCPLLPRANTALLQRGVWLIATLLISTSSVVHSETPLQRALDFHFVSNAGAAGLIAFSATVDGTAELYALDLETGQVVKLHQQIGSNSRPDFSPDGDKLSFVSTRSGKQEIYLSSWDGTDAARISDTPLESESSTWSEDGTRVVFASLSEPYTSHLFAYTVATGQTHQLTHNRLVNTTPHLAGDARRLAYSTNRRFPGWDVCVTDLLAGSEECLLQGATISYCRPKWSNTGEMLAFSSGSEGSYGIGVMNYATRATTPLTNLKNRNYDAEWSPDDRYIAFSHEAQRNGRYELWIVKVDDGTQTRVLSSRHSIRFPSWTHAKTLHIAEQDACPLDPLKLQPGTCGCGIPDIDTDADGVADCNDGCVDDPAKISPGSCGCGLVEQDPCYVAESATPTPIPVPPKAPRLKVSAQTGAYRKIAITLTSCYEGQCLVRYRIGTNLREALVNKSALSVRAKKGRRIEVSYAVVRNGSVGEFSRIVRSKV